MECPQGCRISLVTALILMLPYPNLTPPENLSKKEHNDIIRARCFAGESLESLKHMFNNSIQRVHQIIYCRNR
jgi:hypothetical protein